MAWVRVDDHFDEHPKLARVGPLGWGVWLAGIAYCNRNLTDGFIPWEKARGLVTFEVVDDDGMVMSLAWTSKMAGQDIDMQWAIDLMVRVGLWKTVYEGERVSGYRIHDYDEYQPSKAEVLADRSQNAKRQSKHRQRLKDRNGESNAVTNAGSNAAVTGAPYPKPVARTQSVVSGEKKDVQPVAGRAAPPAGQPTTDDAAQDETAVPTAVANVEAQASEIIRAANHGMVHNDRVDANRFRPIETSHSSRSFVIEWLQDGLPFDLILQTVTDRARAYRPGGRRQQISTMSYFEKAVMEEWERRQAEIPPGSQAASVQDEYPGNGRADRRSGPVRVDGHDPEKEKQERERRELAAITRWCQQHPDDAAEIRSEVELEVSEDNRWKGMPASIVQRAAEGLYRERVQQRSRPGMDWSGKARRGAE